MIPTEEIAKAYKKTSLELFKDPDSPEHLTNHLTLLVARGERNPAHLALARRAVTIAPDAYVAVQNLSAVLSRAGHYDEALNWQLRALELAANEEQRRTALDHIGICWSDLGDFDKALEYYAKALAISDDREIRASIAIAKLTKGDLANGLYEYECLYHKKWTKPLCLSGIPRWMGEDLTGKTLIIGHEQGWGDSLQFCRVIPLIRQRYPGLKRVIFSGPPALNILFSENFADVDEFVGEEGPFHADYYCSPISGCGALRLSYDDIDGLPFLRARPINLPERGLLKVGLSWAGNKDFAHDSLRSTTLATLAPILELPGAAFYSLQVGRGQDEITKLGLDGFVADLGGTFKNWRASARAFAALDVIVATDSANAHLAGALGKPVLQLLHYSCCWRWLREGYTTPWYRNTRLFRQPKPNDWDTPVSQVKSALEGLLNERRSGRRQAVA